jgi:hypothetical protein
MFLDVGTEAKTKDVKMKYRSSVTTEPLEIIDLKDVSEGQIFIEQSDVSNKNPEIYKKLTTHGHAWSFLKLSDMRQYSAFDLKWAHNQKVPVIIVDMISVNIECRLRPLDKSGAKRWEDVLGSRKV